jgi:hypothetical protein
MFCIVLHCFILLDFFFIFLFLIIFMVLFWVCVCVLLLEIMYNILVSIWASTFHRCRCWNFYCLQVHGYPLYLIKCTPLYNHGAHTNADCLIMLCFNFSIISITLTSSDHVNLFHQSLIRTTRYMMRSAFRGL